MVRALCFFLFALTNVKNGCCYVWAFEVCGNSNKLFVTTVMNVFDRMTLFVMGFFLLFLTRSWFIIAGTYWLIGVIALMLIAF